MPLSLRTRPWLRRGAVGLGVALAAGAVLVADPSYLEASSHREAPLIADDPLADNTDVYAFRSPDDPSTVTIVANYIPFQLPEGGPNFHHFGENVRYEIHVKNETTTGALGSAQDDITYRFTFTRTNQDPSTFFNIRLGLENLKTTYTMERSVDGGVSFQTVVTNGVVPPPDIGPRSIESGAGLNTTYEALTTGAIMTASSGERVFAGPRDDAFFVDLGGAFDLGGFRDSFGGPENPDNARDGVAGLNVQTIALQIPIATLQKDGLTGDQADNILDPDFVIGVWASASRPQIRTLSTTGDAPTHSGPWVQVSRLGMPLTNEAVIPIGQKDRWNATSPYSVAEQSFVQYFTNPELALYMGNGTYGAAVPGLSEDLRIPLHSYPAVGDPDGDGSAGFNFNNNADGVFDLVEAGADLSGTAFAVPLRPTGNGSPSALAGNDQPRRVDILPIFYFGVPNLIPYQLATGKTGGPLSAGKPFVNNFLPITNVPGDGLYGGDMLRLNMATPVTPRGSAEFNDWARLGLIRAAALGLTAAPYNTSTALEFIPHMDGFPNGRRLEDDVTGIELQAVGGLVLAAVGLPFDDAVAGNYSDLASPFLLDALSFLAGPTRNDLALRPAFPYLANPHRGYSYVRDLSADPPAMNFPTAVGLGVGVPGAFLLEQNAPNPSRGRATIQVQVARTSDVRLDVFDVQGRRVTTLLDARRTPGTYSVEWDGTGLAAGRYLYRLTVDGEVVAARQATLVR